MYKVKIFSIGKNKKSWLDEALQSYQARLAGRFDLQWQFLKDLPALKRAVFKLPSYICLDERGHSFTSKEFSRFLFREFAQCKAALHFVIGGAEGLDSELLQGASHRLSFSKCTFPHQIARLILIEQIYRAAEIEKNTSYHKE